MKFGLLSALVLIPFYAVLQVVSTVWDQWILARSKACSSDVWWHELVQYSCRQVEMVGQVKEDLLPGDVSPQWSTPPYETWDIKALRDMVKDGKHDLLVVVKGRAGVARVEWVAPKVGNTPRVNYKGWYINFEIVDARPKTFRDELSSGPKLLHICSQDDCEAHGDGDLEAWKIMSHAIIDKDTETPWNLVMAYMRGLQGVDIASEHTSSEGDVDSTEDAPQVSTTNMPITSWSAFQRIMSAATLVVATVWVLLSDWLQVRVTLASRWVEDSFMHMFNVVSVTMWVVMVFVGFYTLYWIWPLVSVCGKFISSAWKWFGTLFQPQVAPRRLSHPKVERNRAKETDASPTSPATHMVKPKIGVKSSLQQDPSDSDDDLGHVMCCAHSIRIPGDTLTNTLSWRPSRCSRAATSQVELMADDADLSKLPSKKVPMCTKCHNRYQDRVSQFKCVAAVCNRVKVAGEQGCPFHLTETVMPDRPAVRPTHVPSTHSEDTDTQHFKRNASAKAAAELFGEIDKEEQASYRTPGVNHLEARGPQVHTAPNFGAELGRGSPKMPWSQGHTLPTSLYPSPQTAPWGAGVGFIPGDGPQLVSGNAVPPGVPTVDPMHANDMSQGFRMLASALTSSKEGEKRTLNEQLEDSFAIFLARGCGAGGPNAHVVLGDALTGKELFNCLRRSVESARDIFLDNKLPCLVTNRVARGVASFNWGQREGNPDGLGAADFPTATEESFDQYITPTPGHMEGKPRDIVDIHRWRRGALNQSKMFAAFYGLWHYNERAEAIETLYQLAEDHSDLWPTKTIIALWEELTWRYQEEIRMIVRRVLEYARRVGGGDVIRKDHFKYVALLPRSDGQPWLQFPTTFRLSDENAYFLKQVMPRLRRALERKQYNLLRQNTLGGARGPPYRPGALADELGEDLIVHPKSAYPVGAKLRKDELALLSAHIPYDKTTNKAVCLGFNSFGGCPRGDGHCNFAHMPLRGDVHWVIRAAAARWGGLRMDKNQMPATADAVNGYVAALRTAAHREEEAKRAAKRGRAGEGQSTEASGGSGFAEGSGRSP